MLTWYKANVSFPHFILINFLFPICTKNVLGDDVNRM